MLFVGFLHPKPTHENKATKRSPKFFALLDHLFQYLPFKFLKH